MASCGQELCGRQDMRSFSDPQNSGVEMLGNQIRKFLRPEAKLLK